MDAERLRLQAGLQAERLKGGNKSFSRELLQACRSPEFLFIWLAPFVVFCFLSTFYAYGFLASPNACILASLSLLGAAFLVIARGRSHLYLPLGFAVVVAVFLGTVVGLYVYDHYTIFPGFYANSRTYNNVVPSQPAAAVADAGKIVFTSESFVDIEHSVSLVTEDGETYCVAPVRDNSGNSHVEFWAAGVSCCSQAGDFACDAAKQQGAHAGIVIFDNLGFFGSSRHDHYEKARRKAEAEFGLASAKNPAYVRWVAEGHMDKLAQDYQAQGIVCTVLFNFMYLIASGFLAYFLYQPKWFREAFA